jgi:4-hydroxy-tetrahydrodipicolinate synthase
MDHNLPVDAKPSIVLLNQKKVLSGILPPTTMPFDKEGNLVFSALREQMDFVVEQGAHGVVAGGSTGEGHTLSFDEFVRVMHETHDALGGRLPFVVGLIVNSTREAIERVNALRGLNIAALQITPVHYLFKPSADGTVEHFRSIYDATGIPVLIYNVIPWNYLSVDLMLRIMREVPGVVGMKQSGGDVKSVSDLVQQCDERNIVLTGVDALLYPAFSMGAHGAISALTAALPGICVKMWDAVQRGDHVTGLKLHRALATLWNVVPHDVLPAAAKYIQHKQGLGLYYPRQPMDHVSPALMASIDEAMAGLPV